jgi:cytochrome c peroxidase
MKAALKYLIILVTAALFAGFSWKGEPPYLKVPATWPKPVYDFNQNPITDAKFQLGRRLFYDPILSRDGSISCASCHLQASGFTHTDHDLSHGIQDRIGNRNAPALSNLAWTNIFMWDGAVNHLDVQALAPISNETEMDESLLNVVRKLQKESSYNAGFKAAFGSGKITGQRVLLALSAFQVSLVSCDSKYDKVMRGQEKFTQPEENGYSLFKQHCASCHREPLFGGDRFERNGLAEDPDLKDLGRMAVTQNPDDRHKFKVPSLRNVQYSFPYMHDGRFKTLTQVIKHYNSIADFSGLSSELAKPMNLQDNDRVDLVAFLKTLSDESFVRDRRFSDPYLELQTNQTKTK